LSHVVDSERLKISPREVAQLSGFVDELQPSGPTTHVW